MKRTVRLNERQLHKVINEAVKRVLMEGDEFEPHGFEANGEGYEIEIHPSGDSVRIRRFQNPDLHNGKEYSEPSDWYEIEYDEEGDAYFKTETGSTYYLYNFSRYPRNH